MIYDGLQGSVGEAIQLTLDYCKSDPTNVTATPVIRNITIRHLTIDATKQYLTCEGLSDSPIYGIALDDVVVSGKSNQDCGSCSGTLAGNVSPKPCFKTTATAAPTTE